jgi:hypothetical protein
MSHFHATDRFNKTFCSCTLHIAIISLFKILSPCTLHIAIIGCLFKILAYVLYTNQSNPKALF